MKAFLPLLFLLTIAFLPESSYAQKNTPKTWEQSFKEVDSLTVNGQPKDAYALVNKLADRARVEGNTAMLIKSVMHRLMFQSKLEEDYFYKIVNSLKADIVNAKQPAKSILQSLLAETYWQFYQENRYRFAQRSELGSDPGGDIRTWSLKKITTETIREYMASLSEPQILQGVETGELKEILAGDSTTRNLRPTLYDLLAHRAIDVMMNSQSGLATFQEGEINIADPVWLSDHRTFSAMKISAADSSSFLAGAFSIFQNLLKYHAASGNKAALADADLKRLKFIYDKGWSEERELAYLKSLRMLAEEVRGTEIYPDVLFAEALVYRFAQTNGEPRKADFVKAVEIAERIVKEYPESHSGKKASGMLLDIKQASMEIKAGSFILPDQPSQLAITYKNTGTMQLSIYRIGVHEENNLFGNEEKYSDFLKARNPLLSWSLSLPVHTDYQLHTIIDKLPPLKVGSYVLMAGTGADTNDLSTYLPFKVTSLAVNSRPGTANIQQYMVLDRKEGSVIEGAKIQPIIPELRGANWSPNYGAANYTEKSGLVSISVPSPRQALVTYEGDSLIVQTRWNYSNEKVNDQPRLILFTDRPIYRPGQLVYFKGLLIKNEASKNKIVADQELDVSFNDVNGKNIGKLKLRTNDFGTIQGSFSIPTGILNGQMQLTSIYGSIGVTVEEYKRPAFEVVFEKPTQSYELNDSIKVMGKAISYSGYTLSDARVKYTVSRSIFSPMGMMRRPYGMMRSEQIAIGSTKTDNTGSFVIPFFAAARPGANENYTYEIKAEVTDLSGETITNTRTINAGTKDILLNAAIPQDLLLDAKPDSLSLTLTNLNNEPISGTIKVEWQLLETPGRLVNANLFYTVGASYTMSKEEFIKLFPYESYKGDDNPANWPVSKIALKQSINVATGSAAVPINSKALTDAYYKLKLTGINASGDTAILEQIVNVHHEEPTKIQSMREWLVPITNSIVKGQTAEFKVAGALPVSRVYYEVYYQGNIVEKAWVNTSPMQKIIKINPGLLMEESFAVQFTMVQNGYTYNSMQTIQIEDPSKELNIKFLSFRDKLQPGEKESWKLSISSKNGDKQMVELAATLYDASLDKLKSMDWNRSLNTRFDYSAFVWGLTQSYARPGSELWFKRRYIGVDYYGQRDYERLFQYSEGYGGYLRAYYNYMRILEAARLQRSSAAAIKKLGTLKKGSRHYGLVTDTYGLALPGVSVRSGKLSVITDENGIYSIDVKTGAQLTFSYIGYKITTVSVGKDKRMDVKLSLDQQGLNEIVTTRLGEVSQQKSLSASDSRVVLRGTASPVAVDATIRDFASVEMNEQAGDAVPVPRTNFSETAFFYPQLRTNEKGEISIDFTIPQSLTRYKMLGFAHTKDLKTANISRELITQKQLAISAHAPRFFREGDTILFAARLNNLAGKELKGKASLELRDALTGKVIKIFGPDTKADQDFSLANAANSALNWPLIIPAGVSAITYKITASSGNFSDGEEMTIPVLPNSMLVTESMALNVRGNTTKTFRMEKLINSVESETLRHHKLTLEFTSNPLWYAIQALPYMVENQYDCSEQIFTRFYANSFAKGIISSSPYIKTVFESWQKLENGNALLSNLEKNQELKSILLEETPWVRAAESETERKKRLAVLFDLNRMAYELNSNLDKLEKMQHANGAFPWFTGMQDDRYITQHIVLGIGQLIKLNLVDAERLPRLNVVLNKAIKYLDGKFKEDKAEVLNDQNIAYLPLHYLYARSYSPRSKDEEVNRLTAVYLKKIAESWKTMEPYQQGQSALILSRNGQKPEALKIITMLKGTAQQSDEMGMYWVSNRSGWWWYQNPVETQSLLIEAFAEVASDLKSVEEMKIWLIKNKQTTDWKTSKATAAACYALLLQGTSQLANSAEPEILVAGKSLSAAGFPVTGTEAGTGYRKMSIDGPQVSPQMGVVEVKNNNDNIAWGGLYWQYFEQLDKIKQAETGVRIKKELYLRKSTNSGDVLQLITEGITLKPGDLLKVRIEIYTDRDMEYIHLKDMRSSGFEPVNVLSQYKYQDGLGYYESTKDASTNFFISYLRKGVYVFEYPLRVSHSGNFSNGITSLQSMYAPEFTTHSEGVRVRVE